MKQPEENFKQNKLKINVQKTQFLVIKQQHLAKHFQNTSINIGNSIIHQVTKAKNLGVILDQCLTMKVHQKLVANAFIICVTSALFVNFYLNHQNLAKFVKNRQI